MINNKIVKNKTLKNKSFKILEKILKKLLSL